jgi:hypothetical protein
VLGIEARVLHMLNKCFAIELPPQPTEFCKLKKD